MVAISVTKALERLRRKGGKISLSLLICALLVFAGPIVFAQKAMEPQLEDTTEQGKDSLIKQTVFEFSFAPSVMSFYSRDRLINDPLPFSEYSLWIKEWPAQFEFRILPFKGIILEAELKGNLLWKSKAGTLLEEKSFDKGGSYGFRLTTGWRKPFKCPVGLGLAPIIGYSQQMSRWSMPGTDYSVTQRILDLGGEIRFTDDVFGLFWRGHYGGLWEKADIDGVPVSVLYKDKRFLNLFHIKFGGELKVSNGFWVFLEIDGNETIFFMRKKIKESFKMDGSSYELLIGIKLKLPREKADPK